MPRGRGLYFRLYPGVFRGVVGFNRCSEGGAIVFLWVFIGPVWRVMCSPASKRIFQLSSRADGRRIAHHGVASLHFHGRRGISDQPQHPHGLTLNGRTCACCWGTAGAMLLRLFCACPVRNVMRDLSNKNLNVLPPRGYTSRGICELLVRLHELRSC